MTNKKKLALLVGLVATVMAIVLAGCSAFAPKDHKITYSGWLFEMQDEDNLRESFEEKGCTDITKNEDGSVTLTIPGDRYEEYVADLRQGMQDMFDNYSDSEDYPNIATIESDVDYTEVTITLETDKETLMDALLPIAIGAAANMYQQTCDLPVSCHIVTLGANGTQLAEVTYPLADGE